MTIEYLDELIYETCLMQKKIRLNELENILNISSDVIQGRLNILIPKYGLSFQNNQLLTKEFIQMIMLDISDTLKIKKICNLTEISFKFEVDLEFLISFFNNPDFNKFIDEEFKYDRRTNYIYSLKYVNTMNRRLMGILNGSTVPKTKD